LTPDFFSKLGGFDPGFRYSGDYELFARALTSQSFDRIPSAVALHRRHGHNASMSQDPRVQEENNLVAARYSPSSAIARRASKLLLKTWLNVRNPRWAAFKNQARLSGIAGGESGG
jgi:hypothetical protein